MGEANQLLATNMVLEHKYHALPMHASQRLSLSGEESIHVRPTHPPARPVAHPPTAANTHCNRLSLVFNSVPHKNSDLTILTA